MRPSIYVALGGLVLALIVGSDAFFVTTEREQAVVTQFGKPVGAAISAPGLHGKIPLVQTVHRFDKRWLEWDGSAEEMPTREKTYIVVDVFARWRIADPLKFFTSVIDEQGAQSRLDDIIGSETRNVIAAHNLIEVVRTSNRPFEIEHVAAGDDAFSVSRPTLPHVGLGRERITRLILEKAAAAVPAYGIELVDVQFQRVNYTDSVRRKVFERMVSERKRIAEYYRSQGAGKSAEILGGKERELKGIRSDGYRQVQEIQGEADAKAAAIYAAAHQRDPDFYETVKALDTYKNTFDEDTLVVLSTESDFFSRFASKKSRGVPRDVRK